MTILRRSLADIVTPRAVGLRDVAIEIEPWMGDSLCAQTDPEIFFPEKGGSTKEARKICTGCPVVDQCLSYALKNDEVHGIWGGTTRLQRRKMARGGETRYCRRGGCPNQIPADAAKQQRYCSKACRQFVYNASRPMHHGGDAA